MLATFGYVLCFLLLPQSSAPGQSDARALVQRIVKGELAADAKDHSRWMYRDAKKVPDKSTVKLVIQTAEGTLSKTIAIDGHPPTPEEQQQDAQKMHKFVTDPSVRQKQREDNQQDDAKARALTEMLPNAFLWTRVAEQGEETTLSFAPDPKFSPPSREARVFAAMKGTMVVNTKQDRIVSLQGVLSQDVDFGFGLLGQLKKGGTFEVQRTQIGPRVWEITATHIHIQGHILLFKSINEQQDEETNHYKRAPRRISLAAAAKRLNDGAVAKEVGVVNP